MIEDGVEEYSIPSCNMLRREVLGVDPASRDECPLGERDLQRDVLLEERWEEESWPDGWLHGSLHRGEPSSPQRCDDRWGAGEGGPSSDSHEKGRALGAT
jgi:hypothetical protein